MLHVSLQTAIENAVVQLASSNPELAFAMTDVPTEDDGLDHKSQKRLPKAAKGHR